LLGAFQHSLVVQAKRINTVFLFGGVDMERWLSRRRSQPFMAFGRERVKFFEKPTPQSATAAE
jgi:hypothetical protein